MVVSRITTLWDATSWRVGDILQSLTGQDEIFQHLSGWTLLPRAA